MKFLSSTIVLAAAATVVSGAAIPQVRSIADNDLNAGALLDERGFGSTIKNGAANAWTGVKSAWTGKPVAKPSTGPRVPIERKRSLSEMDSLDLELLARGLDEDGEEVYYLARRGFGSTIKNGASSAWTGIKSMWTGKPVAKPSTGPRVPIERRSFNDDDLDYQLEARDVDDDDEVYYVERSLYDDETGEVIYLARRGFGSSIKNGAASAWTGIKSAWTGKPVAKPSTGPRVPIERRSFNDEDSLYIDLAARGFGSSIKNGAASAWTGVKSAWTGKPVAKPSTGPRVPIERRSFIDEGHDGDLDLAARSFDDADDLVYYVARDLNGDEDYYYYLARRGFGSTIKNGAGSAWTGIKSAWTGKPVAKPSTGPRVPIERSFVDYDGFEVDMA